MLRRPLDDRMIGGVCAALGRYFDLDTTLVRLAWLLCALLGGSGLLAYLIAWYIIPDERGQRSTTPLMVLFVFFVLLPLLGCLFFFVPFTVTRSEMP
jgi:phage shock protein PspC (stress-responsive transcriptional regulator)